MFISINYIEGKLFLRFSQINKISIPTYRRLIKHLVPGLKELVVKIEDDFDYLENNCIILILRSKDINEYSFIDKTIAMVLCLKRGYQKLEINKFLEDIIKAYSKSIASHLMDDYFLNYKQMLPINSIMFQNPIYFASNNENAKVYSIISKESVVLNINNVSQLLILLGLQSSHDSVFFSIRAINRLYGKLLYLSRQSLN